MAIRRQTAKFVYDSKINIIDTVRKNSSAIVTSGGIYDSIKNMSSTALLDSGYVADCIISVDKNSTVNIVKDEITEKNTVTLGSLDDESTYFIPNGRDANGNPIFDHVTLPAGEIITGIRHSTADTVTTADLAVLYDAEENKIILRPTRVGFIETDDQGNPRGGFFQYIFARYQNINDPGNGYGPRTDKSTTADDYTIWWDLTENVIKERLTNNWVVKRYSIPVALIRYEDSEITGFANDFTVAGYLENAMWINPGVTFNFPSGRAVNETNTLICDAKTSGFTTDGEPTYQPILKVLMYEPCDTEDEHEKTLLPTLYVDNFGNEYLPVGSPFLKHDKTKEEENFTYYYDAVNPLNNTIQYIKMAKKCLDVNTLSLYKSSNGSSFSKIEVGTYSIADDAKTIILENPIIVTNTEDEEHGGVVIQAVFYETNENLTTYVTDTWEIKGPTDEYAFDNNLGYYMDIEGNPITCCRFATVSSGYVVPKNMKVDESLSIIAFNPRTCFTLADNDDIESIMALIGSATGETMDQVLTSIEELNANMDELNKSLRQLIEETKTNIEESTNRQYVHNTGRENIAGVKTFTDGIVGDLSGTASTVDKTFGTVELMPMGIIVAHAEAVSGVSGPAAPNMGTIFLNDIRIDGTLMIKCVADNASATEAADSPLRQNSTEYSQQDKFKVPIGDKYKVFEVIAGVGTDEDPNHEYTNADPIGVMKSQVRIGSNYIAADEFRGVATKAKWADLAEVYESDRDYEPGTLIMFGGDKEITLANFGYAHGVVSSKPAYLMNSEAKGLPVAMIGRVPVRVFGPIDKFDRIYMNMAAPGTATRNGAGEPLGIALESNDFKGEKLVTCVVKLKF